MSEQLKDLILRTLTIIPGIVGIASMNFDKSNLPLKEIEFKDGIQVEETTRGIELSIAIILEHNINNNVVSTEINNAIKNILGQENIKLSNLKIYIRGVK